MRHFTAALFLLAFTAAPAALLADSIPYGNVGTVAPTQTFTATATGNVVGYFYSASASDTDLIRMVDTTAGHTFTSAWFFNNQTTAVGTQQNFGSVFAGDTVIFELENTSLSNAIFSSDSSLSADSTNHAYATAFSGNGTIPAGIFIGMEDLPNGSSDMDYNDDTFVFTNIGTSTHLSTDVAPEPSSLVLFGTGILGVAGALRRKMFKS